MLAARTVGHIFDGTITGLNPAEVRISFVGNCGMVRRAVEGRIRTMITFTPSAIAQWRREHPAADGPHGACVVVSVAAGGCAGLKYVLTAVPEPRPGDHVFALDGFRAACAAADLPRLDGLVVDYVEAMVGGGYRFDNPNAGRSCGCGQSFGE